MKEKITFKADTATKTRQSKKKSNSADRAAAQRKRRSCVAQDSETHIYICKRS